MDPATLSANFLRRVMEARSPNIRLGKASILTPHAISKYPLSAPAKPAKSRIPKLHDTSRKGVPEPVVRKLVSTPSKCASSPRKVRSGKAAKTTSRKKCLKKSGSFRSLRNSKVLISLKGHVRPVAKTLVFHTPNRTRKPTKAEPITSSAARAELKKFETESEGSTQLAVGHMCKSSRCAANNPNYNKPVSVPARIRPRAHKQPAKQEQEAPTMNSKKPEASVAENKHDKQVHLESLLFDDGTMVGKKSSRAGNRNVVQRSSDTLSCGSVEIELDKSSRNRSLEIYYEMDRTVNEESETLEQNQPIREVADEALEILKEAATASNQEVIQNKTASANLVKCDPAQHENGAKEEAELWNKSEDMNYGETTDRSSAYDLASEVGGLKVRLENEKGVHDSAVTPSTQQYIENSIGTGNLVPKEHGQIDQTCNGLEDDKEINDTECAIELVKESCTKHQNEKRKGITTSHMRSGKKRSILNSVNVSNLDPQERKSERKGLKDMALDDFDDAENENKENTSVSANNSNLRSINYNSENGPGKKNLYEIPKKILEAPAEKFSQGMNSARMERKTTKLTNQKPFRFRTNERGILREANLEKKKLQALENFADIQTKQINPIQTETEKTLQQTQQYRNVSAKQIHTESRKKVVKSRYLTSGKPKHPKKDADSSRKTLEKSHETETITDQAKDQMSEMPPVQAQSIRVLKPRKRWNTPAALPEKIVSDAKSRQVALQTIEIAAENSPCTKSKSCLRGRRPPTIPNGPNLRTIHRRPVLQRNQQMTVL